MTTKILSVGNCGYDNGQLTSLLASALSADVTTADTTQEALAAAADADIVLVNRVLDRTGESGIELVRQLKQQRPAAPVMLISNYPDAQQQAVEAGAEPGFGKSEMHDPALPERISKAIAVSAAPKAED